MSEFDIFKLIRSTPSRDKKSTRSRIEEDFPTSETPKIEDFIEGTEEKKYKNRERKIVKKDEFLNEEIVERKKERKYKNQLRKINLVELDKLSAKNQNKVLIREYIEAFEKLESYENELDKLDEKINGNNVVIHHIKKESTQFRDAIRSFVAILPNGSEAKRQLETNNWKVEDVSPLILSKLEELVDRAKNIDVHIDQATKQLGAENKTLQKKFVQQQTEIAKRDQYIEELKKYYEEQIQALTKQHQQTLQKSKQHYEAEMQKIKHQYDAQFQKIIQQQEAEKQQVRQQLEQQIKQQLEPQIKQQLEQQIKQQLEQQVQQQIKQQVNQQVNQKIQSTKQRFEKEIAELKKQLQAAKEQTPTQPTIIPPITAVPLTPPVKNEPTPTLEENFQVEAPTFEEPTIPAFEIEEPKLPSFEVEEPTIPAFEIEEPKLPSFEVEEPTVPSFEIEEPTLPSFEVEEPSIPAFEIEEPTLPSFEIEEPTIPSFEIEEPTIPSFEIEEPKLPSFEIEEPKLPSFEAEEPSIPAVQEEKPTTEMQAPSMPTFEIEEPEMPSFELPAPPAFELAAPPSLDIPAPPSFEEPEEEEEEDDSDELVMFDPEPYLRSLSDTNKAIIKIIGKTGVSRNKELKDFLESDDESIDLFMKGSKFNQQEMSSTIKGLKDAGFLNAETVKLGAKGGYNFTVYELSDLGKGVYKSLSGKKAVVSEKKKITDQHASLEHGYLIKESATEFAEMGYKVYTDRKDLRFDLPGGKRKDFDIIIEKDGKKCMIEVERGTHNEEDFFNAMDKIFQITNEFYFICPNEQILFGKTKIAFFRWIKERLGGIQNAKGKLTAYFTTLEKVKKRGKTIWEPVDFK